MITISYEKVVDKIPLEEVADFFTWSGNLYCRVRRGDTPRSAAVIPFRTGGMGWDHIDKKVPVTPVDVEITVTPKKIQ